MGRPVSIKGRPLRNKELNCQSHGFDKPSNVLLAIAARARDIRKLLSSTGKQADQEAWGLLRDAVRLASAIEAIASNATDLPAEDATATAEMLEILQDQLEAKAAHVLVR